MSREAAAGDVPLGAAAAAGNRLVSEPAFELLFSEIIAYTGAYVSHSAASHATDMLRAAEAGVAEGEGVEKDGGGEGGDGDANGALVEPSPASVGAGNQLLPVRVLPQEHRHRVWRGVLTSTTIAVPTIPVVPLPSPQPTHLATSESVQTMCTQQEKNETGGCIPPGGRVITAV